MLFCDTGCYFVILYLGRGSSFVGGMDFCCNFEVLLVLFLVMLVVFMGESYHFCMLFRKVGIFSCILLCLVNLGGTVWVLEGVCVAGWVLEGVFNIG